MTTYNYKWPTLAEEGLDMIHICNLMYGFACLREMARDNLLTKGDAEVNKRILCLPVTDEEIFDAAKTNEEALIPRLSHGDHKSYEESLLHTMKAQRQRQYENSTSEIAQVVVFDDENSTSELVYGIEVDPLNKRIVVAFRGSATPKDFMIDAKAYMCDLPNPLEPDSNETIGVHHGFYEYLFETSNSRKGGESMNKCDKIMGEVMSFCEKYPDYMLYCTGHSLGASLATLFALEAAASKDERIPKPVTLIAVASPKVGNKAFQKAFQSLEKEGLIRCLRIQNQADAVTVLPEQTMDVRCYSCGDYKFYKHVGLEITLYKSGAHEFGYSRVKNDGNWSRIKSGSAWFGKVAGVAVMLPIMVFHSQKFLTNHNPGEYAKRLTKFGERNKDLYLNDVYRDDVPDCDGEFGMSLGIDSSREKKTAH